jgi:hypothetical protein
MFRTAVEPYLCFLIALPLLYGIPSATVASDIYDVSYVWSHNAAGVLDYHKQVSRVLGPGVAKDLQVVARDDLFGLSYRRRGDSEGATRVARAHTQLLQSRGLEAAAPIRSHDWTPVDAAAAAGSEAAVSPSVPKRSPEADTSGGRSEGVSRVTIWVPIDGVLVPMVLSKQAEEMSISDSNPPAWLQKTMDLLEGPVVFLKDLFTQPVPAS